MPACLQQQTFPAPPIPSPPGHPVPGMAMKCTLRGILHSLPTMSRNIWWVGPCPRCPVAATARPSALVSLSPSRARLHIVLVACPSLCKGSAC